MHGFLRDCDLLRPAGSVSAPQRPDDERDAVQRTISEEFAAVCRTGISHHLDVHRGLYLQELIQG